EVIEAIQSRAAEVASGAGAQFGAVLDIVTGGFGTLGVNNMRPEVFDYLKEIPGFEEFFGSQAYCTCRHCQSILGPAAYFVDLMRFIDTRITQPHFATAAPSHPLRLQTRRPDLWKLELTCENTNTPIPYLTVINEVLEDAIAAEVGYAGPAGDRAAIGRTVYRDTLPEREDGFDHPFHLPLEELKSYLRHFETPLAEPAEAAGHTGDALTRLRLGLSPRAFRLVVESREPLADLRRIYGFAFGETAGVIDKFDAQQLVRACRATREELQELLATQYVTARGAVAVKIVGEKHSAESVQNDVERVQGATRAVLDRLHRFVRLWRAVGWRVGELDLAIQHLEDAGLGAGLDAPLVGAVARLARLAGRLELSVEELLALWSPLPVRAATTAAALEAAEGGDDEPAAFPAPASPLAYLTVPLFSRVFNPPGAIGGDYPQDATTVLHPALAVAGAPAPDPHLARLKAGLGTDDDGLYRLVVGLADALGIDPDAAAEADRRIALTRRNLSILYRHARLAGALRMGIPELLALAAGDPALPLGFVDSLDDLEALVRTAEWWRDTRWSAAQLAAIVRPGTPAVLTSAAPVAGSAAGDTVTYTVTRAGEALAPETVTLAGNADLAAVIADWNGKAQNTVAYRSDASGAPARGGSFLSIRAPAGEAGSAIEITADSAGCFAAAPPRRDEGRPAGRDLIAGGSSPTAIAAEIVEAIGSQGRLAFADTIFALLPPTPPLLVSAAAVAGSAGGETVTVAATLDGRVQAPETVTLAANAALDDVIADWNRQATIARAFRADAAGTPSATGDRLALRAEGGAGADTLLEVTADSASIFTGAPPLLARGVEVTPEQSQAIAAANAGRFEPAGGTGKLRLRADYDPAAPLALPAGIDPALEPRLRAELGVYHGERLLLAELPGRLAIAPERLRRLVGLLGTRLDTTALFRELRGESTPPAILGLLIQRLQRLALLFADDQVFTVERLGFVGAEAARFGLSRFDRIGLDGVRAVESYRRLLARSPGADPTPVPVDAVVAGFDTVNRFAGVDPAALGRVLGIDPALARSLATSLTLPDRVFPALETLDRAAAVAQRLGVAGDFLAQLVSTDYDTLAQASAALQAGFRTRYEDEAEWRKTVEPFQDRILSRRRDGLVAWMLDSSSHPFDEVTDLYHYYLLDVQIEGCMRTSRVAAAIDSLQLYVQRCLMNLEESPAGAPDPRHVLPASIPEREWSWRRHYRVWEANRKIFLYPENWIEPELRDDKTPLFRALEEELFSKEISEETILEAYARYLRGFDELSHLSIAGSYHEKDEKTQRDVLHLIGATADDPPVFYYRRVENAEAGVSVEARATRWGAWERLDVQIPVRRAAPLIHQG
ncbi:MAG TPA: neuraminidase-like domain-containing protein, partial [Gemmatimonadales bacterium]|nr:neuraminidase-like domain-containing protein [Gemmatimonadales bacterium]